MFAVFDNVMFTKRGNIRVERKELHSLWSSLMYETFCLRVVEVTYEVRGLGGYVDCSD